MEERKQAMADAQQAAKSAAMVAVKHGVPKDNIVNAALDPLDGGSGSVGSAIVRYVSMQNVCEPLSVRFSRTHACGPLNSRTHGSSGQHT